MLEQVARLASYITLLLVFIVPAGHAEAIKDILIPVSPSGMTSTTTLGTNASSTVAFVKDQAVLCNGSWEYGNIFNAFDLEHNFGCNNPATDGTYNIVFVTSTTTSGIYYLCNINNPSFGASWPECYASGNKVATFIRSGGVWTSTGTPAYEPPSSGYDINFSSQYETRFTDVNMGSASSSVDFDISFYIDADEATTTQSDRNPTMVRVRYSKNPSTDYSGYGVNITDAVSPTWGYGTTSFSLELDPSSTYDVSVSFANGGTALTGIVPFPLAYVYFTVVTDTNGGIATTSNVEYYDAVQEQAFEYQPCGITDIGGCISNALMYVFVPSNASLDRFASIEDDLADRSPFVYVYQLPEYWDTLFDTANSHSLTVSASTSIGTITFISEAQLDAIPLTNTVRTIVGYLLWVMLAFTLYVRVTGLFNHNNQTV